MIIFTYFGGMEAVIWIEVVQLGIYVFGALAAAAVIAKSVSGGFGQALAVGQQFGKFDWIDLGLRPTLMKFSNPFTGGELFSFTAPLDFTKTYTFWAGLVGGCFLNMSTHGTDQYLVQRYLCTDKPRRAALALLSSGGVVLLQFIGFLFIGVLLFAFYKPYEAANYAAAAPTFPFAGGDKVFPDFITQHLPSGLSGLVVAAIFAAALSSSLNSIAATAVNDLYKPLKPKADDRHLFKVSQILTLVWGVVQILVALYTRHSDASALNKALSIASLFNGPVLGVFLVGSFLPRVSQTPALIGMLTSCAVMLGIFLGSNIAWPWYVLIGSSVTFIVSWLAGFAFNTDSN
jgi:Na+/proline symporter